MAPPQKTTTDIRHFLTERGEIPEALPPRARNLLNFLGGIVRSFSGSRQLFSSNPIYCGKRLGSRRCRGTIAAYCENKDATGPIRWICPDCHRSGEIFHWQGSIFDQTQLRRLAQIEYERQGVWINGQRLDELQLPLCKDGSTTSYLVFPSQRTSTKLDAAGRLRLQIPGLLCIELFQRRILRLGESTEVKLGEKEPIRFRFLGVRYASED